MKLEHLNEIKGIVILALSLILLASLVSFTPVDLSWFTSKPNFHAQNWIGIVGAYTAGMLFLLVGLSAYFFVGIGLFFSWNKFTSRDLHFNFFKFLSTVILFVVIAALFSFFAGTNGSARLTSGGIIGVVFSNFLVGYFQPLGALIILLTLGALALIVTGEFLVSPFFVWLWQGIVQVFQRIFKGVPLAKIPKGTRHSEAKQSEAEESKMALRSFANAQDDKKDGKYRSTVFPKPPELKAAPLPVKPNIHIVAAPKTEEVSSPLVQAPKRIGE